MEVIGRVESACSTVLTLRKKDGSSTLLYGSWGERVEVGNTYAFSQLKEGSRPYECYQATPATRVRAVPGQTDGGNLNKVEKSKNLTGSLVNMGKPGKLGQQKEAAVKKEGQSSKSETDHERSKAIKPEPQENLKLESRGRKMSAQQEQLLKKLQRGPTLISPPAQRVKEQRPKGRTIRKAHYDPHEVPEEKKEAILARRLQNDSKCGGRSRTSIMSKGPQRLGSDRGFGRPYRERPDRCFSIDEDEDGPRYPEDDF